jgi:DNA repair exonuclease SbcCD ATPase subunit
MIYQSELLGRTRMTEKSKMSDMTELAPVEPQSTDMETQAELPKGDEGEKTDKQNEAADKADPLKKIERRLGRVTAQRYEQEARAKHAEARAYELEQKLAQLQSPRNQASDDDANPVDVEQIVRHVRAHVEGEGHQKAMATRVQSVISEGRKLSADFDNLTRAFVEAAGSLVDNNQQMKPFAEAIMDSDHSAKLIVYLGEHDDEAAELAQLSKVQQIKRIAMLEAKLTQSTRKVSSAPTPLQPEKSASGNRDPGSMSTSEYIAWRNKSLRDQHA